MRGDTGEKSHHSLTELGHPGFPWNHPSWVRGISSGLEWEVVLSLCGVLAGPPDTAASAPLTLPTTEGTLVLRSLQLEGA